MQMISRPAHCKICEFRGILSMFFISWISTAILAKTATNRKWQRKIQLFNPVSVKAVHKTSPDSSCIVKIWGALYEVLRVFKMVTDFKPIETSKTSVVTIPDSFDLEQLTTRSRLNSEFFDRFLLTLVKEIRIQNASITEEPLCKGRNDYLLDNDKIPETRNASSGYLSDKKTSNLTVQNGGSKTRVSGTLWNLHSSWEVIEEDGPVHNAPIDQSTIRSETPFPQYHLWPVTSASEGTVENQSSMWPIKFVRDCTVAIQSLEGSINSVEEKTPNQPKSKRSLQFGMSETPESGKLQLFLPLVSSDASQLGFSTASSDEPMDELEQDLFTPIEDRQIDFVALPKKLDLQERNERCKYPDLGFCDMDQSPQSSPSKKSCGICYTEIEKSKFFARRRYGLLSNCHHVFCYPCIHKHCMPTSVPLIESALCPKCLQKSEVIAASTVWMEGDEKDIFFKEFAAEMKGTRNQNVLSKATFLSQTDVLNNLVASLRLAPCGIV